jgi:hypothetical protein
MGMTSTAAQTQIRQLSRVELPLCVPFGRDFHREFNLPGDFKPSVFLRNWQTFYDRYEAAVIGLWDGPRLVGGLGCMMVPDLSDGRLCGQEMFWFVDPAHRKGSAPLRLLTEYGKWVEAHGSSEARLVHLCGGVNDERLDKLYRRMGYKPVEVCYRKILTKEVLSCPS